MKTPSPRKYIVSELIEVPIVREIAGQYVHSTEARDAVREQHPDFTDKHGCYVFGIKTKTGVNPVYVGCAGKRPLGFEAFTSHKRATLAEALAYYPNAKLFIAFVVPEDDEDVSDIKEMEGVLIRYASEKNPDILNEVKPSAGRNAKEGGDCSWYIDGVFNGGRGRRSQAGKAFRAMVGIK